MGSFLQGPPAKVRELMHVQSDDGHAVNALEATIGWVIVGGEGVCGLCRAREVRVW